jgi:tetratricopeptide (TPR) repeat protein
MWTDSLGNAATLEGDASVAALNDFVEGFIASEARAVNILAAAAHDPSPIVQACAAAVHMFAESADAPANARPFLDRALAGENRCTSRERRFMHAVAAWVQGDIPQAIALHEEQAHEFPRDLASLKLGHYHLFNRGDSPGMLRIALAALPAAGDVPYLHGMLAFAWEQCHLLAEAEAAATKAITMTRREPWAHHALAHVMLTQGRIREGHAFLQDVSDTWTGLNSFMVTHNWWHQALFALELDEHAEVLQLYDRRVWGVAKEYSQDQVNAVSLLARLELAGVDVGDRWQDVADYFAPRLQDHVLPFLDMQYLYGLARAGRPEAGTLMRNIESHAATAPQHSRPAWQRVCVPASRGLLAHARGDYKRAIDELGRALPRLLEIGGSHAQRDLFSQVWLDSMIRSGQLVGAQNVLAQQVRSQPESARLKRQAAQVYAGLGLGSIAKSLRWS